MIADNKAVFTIGTVAQMLNMSPRTLRSYEKQGLLAPFREGKWRYYSLDNVKWLGCLQEMIQELGFGVGAVNKLLRHNPCWELAGCAREKRKLCTAFMSSGLVPRRIDRQCC